MATTDNLNITLIESGQTQKEVTANAAFVALDAALTESLIVAASDTPVTVTAADVRAAMHILITNGGSPQATGAHSVVLPATKHALVIANESGYTATITCAGDGSPPQEIVIPADERRLVYCDGTTVYSVGDATSALAGDQVANLVYAGPATGANATPTFRALIWDDLPVGVGSGDGSVTSVALSVPSEFSVSGSPITGAGTLAVTKIDQSANLVYAGPTTGADGAPTFRALVADDIPTQPFDAGAFYPGIPTASAIVVRVPVARAVGFVANFVGSYGTASAAATGSTAFDIQKNGSSIGTATFAGAATTATFVSAAGAAQSLVAGDVLAIIAPATPDATLANVGFVLAGTR